VLIDKTTGDITERSLTTHYLVDTRLVDEGGTVIFDEDHIPSADVWVFLWSKLEYTQTVVLPTDGAFREKKVTNGMDRIVRLVQQLRDKMNRAVLQDFYADTLDLTLPSPESLKVLRWNEDADNLENRDPISEVEMQKTSTHIQWKLTQDTDWINLVALTEITGPQGDPGEVTTSDETVTDENIAVYDGTDGNTIKDGGKSIDDLSVKPTITTKTDTDEIAPDGSKKENEIYISALAQDFELLDPTGVASNGNTIVLQVTATGATRPLSWGDDYEELYADLPDEVEEDKTVTVMFAYFNGDWQLMSVLED